MEEKDDSRKTANREAVTGQLIANVRVELKDPGSANFHDAVLYLAEREVDGVSGYYTLCGMVNSKNTYGAYAGDTGFVSALYLKMVNNAWQHGSNFVFIDGPDDGTDAPIYAAAYKRLCKNAPKE